MFFFSVIGSIQIRDDDDDDDDDDDCTPIYCDAFGCQCTCNLRWSIVSYICICCFVTA